MVSSHAALLQCIMQSHQQQTSKHSGLTSRYILNENKVAETDKSHFIYTYIQLLKVCESHEEAMLYKI